MKKHLNRLLVLLAALAMALPAFGQQASEAPLSRVGGQFVAANYTGWTGLTLTANTGTSTQTYLIQIPGALKDGNPIPPPYVNEYMSFDTGTNQETIQLTSVSTTTCPGGGGGGGANPNCYNVTGSFSNAHGASAVVTTGSAGLDEAIEAGFLSGGGLVTIDSKWTGVGGTDTMINQATVWPSVSLADYRQGAVQFWTPVGGSTAIAVPTTLTSSTVGDALTGTAALATGGHYTNANPYYVCIAYVDIMGQEGACSATYNFTPATGSTNQIGFTTPAASTGAVGYTIYISLTNGSYLLAYKVPLVTQPTATGVYPVSNGVCTLTTVETITPACAVTNTTYNQTGSQAVVSALTLSTSPIDPQVTTVSTTSVYVPNAGGRTTYTYQPGLRAGVRGTVGSSLPFTISAADATTVPSVIGTINLAPGFMNYQGKAIRICGYATTSASTGTIQDIQFQWDAMGQNTAGKGVLLADLTVTKTATSVLQLNFCQDLQTTVTSASATGGSIQNVGGYITSSIASLSAAAAGGDTIAGAVGSLNLADDARINVIYVHTTGTDGTALTLQGLTVTVLN